MTKSTKYEFTESIKKFPRSTWCVVIFGLALYVICAAMPMKLFESATQSVHLVGRQHTALWIIALSSALCCLIFFRRHLRSFQTERWQKRYFGLFSKWAFWLLIAFSILLLTGTHYATGGELIVGVSSADFIIRTVDASRLYSLFEVAIGLNLALSVVDSFTEFLTDLVDGEVENALSTTFQDALNSVVKEYYENVNATNAKTTPGQVMVNVDQVVVKLVGAFGYYLQSSTTNFDELCQTVTKFTKTLGVITAGIFFGYMAWLSLSALPLSLSLLAATGLFLLAIWPTMMHFCSVWTLLLRHKSQLKIIAKRVEIENGIRLPENFYKLTCEKQKKLIANVKAVPNLVQSVVDASQK